MLTFGQCFDNGLDNLLKSSPQSNHNLCRANQIHLNSCYPGTLIKDRDAIQCLLLKDVNFKYHQNGSNLIYCRKYDHNGDHIHRTIVLYLP